MFTSDTLNLRVRAIFADTFVAEVPQIRTVRTTVMEKNREVSLSVWAHRAVEVGVAFRSVRISGMYFLDQKTWSVGVGFRWRF